MFFSFCSFVPAQETNNEDTIIQPPTEETTQDTEKENDGKKEKPLIEKRKDTLKYGINSEIIELIDALKEEENKKLTKEVLTLFENTYSHEVIQSVIQYFDVIDFNEGYERAFSLLQNENKLPNQITAQLINYVSESMEKEYFDFIITFLEHDSQEVISAALKAIGNSSNKDYVSILLQKLEDDDFPSSMKPNILLALGELRSVEAVPKLIDIVQDEREEIIWRQYACYALGKINDPQTINILKEAARSDNALLRAYAYSALGSFNDEEAYSILMEGLKDSYWKSRVRAAEGLAEQKVEAAVPILVYKAENDPELQVRESAVNALAEIGGNEAFDTVAELFTSEQTPFTLRYTALKKLIEKNAADFVQLIQQEIDEHWSDPHFKFISQICSILADSKAPELKPLFSKLLHHPHFLIQICALRGIQRNGFSELRDEVENLTEESIPKQVQETARSVLNSFE